MEASRRTNQGIKLFERSKRDLSAVDYEKNFRFILNTYILIGINFPNRASSTLKASFGIFMTIFYHLFSIYFFLVLTFNLFKSGVTDGEESTAFIQYVITNVIRLHFIFRADKILSALNCLTKEIPLFSRKSQKTLKSRIMLYFLLIIVMVAGISNGVLYPQDSKTAESEVYHFFGQPRPNAYFFILEGVIETTRNFFEISTIGLTFVLLCLVYIELEGFVIMIKRELSTMFSKASIDPKIILDCSDILCKASKIVSATDKEFSSFLFYIILLYIIQIMTFISIFASRTASLLETITFVVLTCNAIVCICVICLLASRIHERYEEIKEIIMTSASARKEMALGDSVAVAIIGLRQILKEIDRNFCVTAIGALQIDKRTIITILCSIITYGVILFQMIQDTHQVNNLDKKEGLFKSRNQESPNFLNH